MRPLKKSKRTVFPPIAVYDIEAINWTDVQVVCHLDELGNRKSFRGVQEYLTWLLESFDGDAVWAHFGSGYDNRFLIEEAQAWHGTSFKAIMSGGLPIIFILENDGFTRPSAKTGRDRPRQVKLLDSFRLLPTSLASVGKSLGHPKMEVDRSRIEQLTFAEQEAYCFDDCEILLAGLQRFRDTIMAQDGSYSPTSASIASNFIRSDTTIKWKEFFEPSSNYLRYSGESFAAGLPGSVPGMLQADEFSEGAYYGGRCEVFRRGCCDGPLYYYDIASAYPWAMKQKLPLYFRGFHPGADWNDQPALEKILTTSGISDAFVDIPEGAFDIPPLPVRLTNGKVVFAEGKFRGRWTNVELLHLFKVGKKRGVRITITSWCRFKEVAFARPFVDMFYALRKTAKEQGDECQSMIYKILLNSCYGKLAQQLEQSCYVFGPAYDFLCEAAEEEGRLKPCPMPGMHEIVEETPGPFRHVAAGAYVTALARLKLIQGIEKAVNLGARIYYCDTDSIIIDRQIPAWNKSKDLGSWELEHTITEAEFLCPKVYRFTTDTGNRVMKAKGANLKSQLELSDSDDNHARESYIRWCVYAREISSWAGGVASKLNTDELSYYGRADAGLRGWKSGMAKGSVECTVAELDRMARNADSKRRHAGDASRPLYLADGNLDIDYLDVRTMDADSLMERELLNMLKKGS